MKDANPVISGEGWAGSLSSHRGRKWLQKSREYPKRGLMRAGQSPFNPHFTGFPSGRKTQAIIEVKSVLGGKVAIRGLASEEV
jgi:hypothetical protein